MKSILVLTIFAPLVLCRSAYNGNDHTGPNLEDFKEIYKLKALTEKLTKQGQIYSNPLESSVIVSTKDVSFFVYNQENKTGDHVLLEDAGNITAYSTFNTNLKTVFVVHGWHNDYLSPIDVLVEAALLAFEDINIISVCWDDLAQSSYLKAYTAVPSVGKQVGEFIIQVSESYGYSMDNFLIIGHSLGAHVAGIAGQETQGKLAAIIGLDPAGPLYFSWIKDGRLSDDDAQYVAAIHTCAKLLGVKYRVGNADFWPNGGYTQVGCGPDLFGTCSHTRSYQYFVESASESNFIARQCDTYDNYKNGNCKQNPKAAMGGPYVNTAIVGDYFLNTNDTSPYAQGDTDL